jgi:hypothetical protein
MADLVGIYSLINDLETKSGSAAAESTMQKIGSALNLLSKSGLHKFEWKVNGPYSLDNTPILRPDMEQTVPNDCTIVLYGMAHHTAGSAGVFQVDILKIPSGGGAAATIFTTQPYVPSSAGNDVRMVVDVENADDLQVATGQQPAAFVSLDLTKGDVLQMNITGVQTNGADASFQLFARPR